MPVIVTFNGKAHTDASLGIRSMMMIKRPILPYTRDRFLPVPGRDGAYDFGRDLEPLEFEMRFMFEGSTLAQTMEYSHAIAAWLNADEVKVLSFDDEPGKRYMARPIKRVWVDRAAKIGIADATFIVPAGYAEAVTPNSQPAQFTFIRASVAYNSSGAEVLTNTPVYEVI